ncbi:uncharacterized protein CANTADRAFT_7274, partial [Suhomyces tanzawaensis NRRL Y-17324]
MFRYRLSKLKASVRAKKKDEGPFVAVIENPLFVDDLILDELRDLRRLKAIFSSTSRRTPEYNLGDSSPMSSQFSYKSGIESNDTSVAPVRSSCSILEFCMNPERLAVFSTSSILENIQNDETASVCSCDSGSDFSDEASEFASIRAIKSVPERIDSSETVEVCSCDLDLEIIQDDETSKRTSNSAVQSIPEIIVSSNTGAHCSSRSEPENIHVDEASECASSWDMESIQEIIGSSRASECVLIPLPEGEADLKRELKGLLLHLENVKEQLYELWLTEGSNHPFYSLLDSQRLTTESEICAINSKLNASLDQASDIHEEDHKIIQNEPDSPIVNDLALPKKSSEASETNLKNELERLLKDQERNKVELARCTAALGTDNLIERMPEILHLKFKQRQIALQISKINSKLNAAQAFPIADNLAVSKKSSDKHEADLKKELE